MSGTRKQAKIVQLRSQIDALTEKIAQLISKRTSLEHDLLTITGHGRKQPSSANTGEGTVRVMEAMRKLRQARELDVIKLTGLTPGFVNAILHRLEKKKRIVRAPGDSKYRPWRIVEGE